MKVRIEANEHYPCYNFMDEYETLGYLVEIDEATAERWRRVIAEWELVQEEMGSAPRVRK